MVNSKDYLPENLKDSNQILFNYLTEIVDYVIENYQTINIEKLKAIYNPYHSWIDSQGIPHNYFDPDYLITLLGNPNFLIYDSLTEDEKRNFASLVGNVYRLKGTRAGIFFVLQLLAFTEINIYEWFYINEQHAEGNKKFPNEVSSCSAIIEILIEGIIDWDGLSEKVADLLEKMIWACLAYQVWWLKRLEDNYYLAQCYEPPVIIDVSAVYGSFDYYSPINLNKGVPLITGELETDYDLLPSFSYIGPLEETVTVGSGGGPVNYPLETSQIYHRTQSIYLQGEVGVARKIDAIAIDVTTIPPPPAPPLVPPPISTRLENFNIRLGHTTSVLLTTWVVDTSFSNVFYRSFFFINRPTLNPASGPIWYVFDLDTPFDYNGVPDNLIVDFSFQLLVDGAGPADGFCNATNLDGTNRTIHYGSNVAPPTPDPTQWSGATPTPVATNLIPDIKILSPSSGGVDQTTGLGASCTALTYAPIGLPSNAVKDNPDKEWYTAYGSIFPTWWKIDLGLSIPIIEYTIQNNIFSHWNIIIKDWIFEGSYTGLGGSWNSLDIQSNQTGWGSYEKRRYSIISPMDYRYYRVSISANNGNLYYSAIPEIEMFTYSQQYVEASHIVDDDDFDTDRIVVI